MLRKRRIVTDEEKACAAAGAFLDQERDEPIVLGANQWGSGDLVADVLIDPFDGTYSEFALYDTALDEDQIKANAADALAGDLLLA